MRVSMIHRATSAEVLHSWTKGRDQPESDPLVLQVGQTTLPHKNTNCYRNKKRCNLVPRGRDPFGRRRGSGFFRRMTKGTPGDEAGSVDNETTLSESVGQTAWRLFAPTGAMRRDDDGDKTLKQRTHLHHPNAWPVPHACAQPYHPGSGSHGQLFHFYQALSAYQTPVRSSKLCSEALYYRAECKALL